MHKSAICISARTAVLYFYDLSTEAGTINTENSKKRGTCRHDAPSDTCRKSRRDDGFTFRLPSARISKCRVIGPRCTRVASSIMQPPRRVKKPFGRFPDSRLLHSCRRGKPSRQDRLRSPPGKRRPAPRQRAAISPAPPPLPWGNIYQEKIIFDS